MLINPGPAISVALHTAERSAASNTICATSRGVLPNTLASASEPFTCASARSLLRTTGSLSCPPAILAKVGRKRSATVRTGSAMVLLLLPTATDSNDYLKKSAQLLAANLHCVALVAQWIERRFPEPQVVGSIPIEGTKQDNPPCESCSSPLATRWNTPDGPAWLCRECANLHGFGCP